MTLRTYHGWARDLLEARVPDAVLVEDMDPGSALLGLGGFGSWQCVTTEGDLIEVRTLPGADRMYAVSWFDGEDIRREVHPTSLERTLDEAIAANRPESRPMKVAALYVLPDGPYPGDATRATTHKRIGGRGVAMISVVTALRQLDDGEMKD